MADRDVRGQALRFNVFESARMLGEMDDFAVWSSLGARTRAEGSLRSLGRPVVKDLRQFGGQSIVSIRIPHHRCGGHRPSILAGRKSEQAFRAVMFTEWMLLVDRFAFNE